MLYIRLLELAIQSLSFYSLFKWGIAGFPWYLSDWQAFGAVLTTVLLVMSHFRTHDDGYDNLVKALYEIALPYAAAATLIYWTTYDIPEITSDWNTWVYPFFMHVAPIVGLLIDFIFNDITFDWKRGVWRNLWALLAYYPLNYFSNEVWGEYAYSFITWDSFSTVTWLTVTAVIELGFFYGFAFLNNYWKNGTGVAHLQSQFINLIKAGGL